MARYVQRTSVDTLSNSILKSDEELDFEEVIFMDRFMLKNKVALPCTFSSVARASSFVLRVPREFNVGQMAERNQEVC